MEKNSLVTEKITPSVFSLRDRSSLLGLALGERNKLRSNRYNSAVTWSKQCINQLALCSEEQGALLSFTYNALCCSELLSVPWVMSSVKTDEFFFLRINWFRYIFRSTCSIVCCNLHQINIVNILFIQIIMCYKFLVHNSEISA